MHYPNTVDIFSVLLADSNRLLGEGLKLILNELDNEFLIIDQQSDLNSLRPTFKKHSPSIILAELFSGSSRGITELQDFILEFPEAKVLVYSVSAEKEHVLESFKHGAVGYLLKGTEMKTVVDALRAVSQGHYYIDPWIATFLIEEVQWLNKIIQSNDLFSIQITAPPDLLSKREVQVMRLLTQGQSNGMISETLQISEQTVKNRISSILSKLELMDRTQIVLKAIKNGWVTL